MEDSKLEIKGLKEKLGVTDDQLDNLRELKVATQMREAFLMMTVWRKGGNIHGVNESATENRRKKNKAAKKARRANHG